ncbi:hypothetical protein [Desulfotomaculum copahuensis]|uniref:Prepilin-type N-terminal cleavage/methylation domain-containing protein n=1 Tax=Desulfotomaculum copahuensis TaxID=1838280 RepID=A0A1B7LBL0_9FIRM|nr:hypothetical protein [Desulfotomaculum copahuensis]OAT79864.1 hypothetical protein A6M21_14790 [Desulfotomaculum copahuensis]
MQVFLKRAFLFVRKQCVKNITFNQAAFSAPKNFNQGFLLLDISLAMLLVAVALLPLQAMFSYSQLHLSAARNMTVAVMLAQSGMEELLDLPYESLVSQNKTPLPGRPGFSRSISVGDSPVGSLKTVVVTVFYPEAGGEKQVSLSARRAVPAVSPPGAGQ